MDKYMSVNVNTAGIKDIDRDGGVSVEELGKMATFEHTVSYQCGMVKGKDESENERV